MTTMRRLAIIALLVAATSPALAQNAPPRDGYPPPAAGASGTPATYGPPPPGVIPGALGPVYSHHHRHSQVSPQRLFHLVLGSHDGMALRRVRREARARE
jgi:hypothetical protein